MWMCRQVAQALRDSRFWELPKRKRVGLLIHVFLCPMCGKYHREVVDFHRCIHDYLEKEAVDEPPESLKLSEDARRKIGEALKSPEA